MEALKILVADDEEVVRSLICTWVTLSGHRVIAEAQDGVEALERAVAHRPDAIIMDIMMPQMDGIEAANEILAQHPCAILFLSGTTHNTTVEQAGETGAVAYLMKPFSKEALTPALEIAVRRFRQIQGQTQEIDRLKETIETRKLIERAKGILMDRHKMTEEEAFRRIHFQARNQNRKMKEIAQSIITAADFL